MGIDPDGMEVDASGIALEKVEIVFNEWTGITGREYFLDNNDNVVYGDLINGDGNAEMDAFLNEVIDSKKQTFQLKDFTRKPGVVVAQAYGKKFDPIQEIWIDFKDVEYLNKKLDKLEKKYPGIRQSGGLGTILLHEFAHKLIGYGFIDPKTDFEKYNTPGPNVSFVNTLRDYKGWPNRGNYLTKKGNYFEYYVLEKQKSGKIQFKNIYVKVKNY